LSARAAEPLDAAAPDARARPISRLGAAVVWREFPLREAGGTVAWADGLRLKEPLAAGRMARPNLEFVGIGVSGLAT